MLHPQVHVASIGAGLVRSQMVALNGQKVENTFGYQETPSAGSKTLLHLYDENGDQLDSGNGHFPNAEWEALPYSSRLEDHDDFWDAIESLRSSI